MPQIHLLDPETVAKMAAGEVIQRPFNAAKELIENATDADAPAIGLFVSNNCYDLIMVYDTGHGIELADYPLLCHRFATSKITTFNDIYSIQSFGFRGEALASISYVSRMIVISKVENQPAHLAVYMNGKLHFDPETLAAEYTDFFTNTLVSNSFTIICVTDLFYADSIRRNQIRSSKASLDMQDLLMSISAANHTREYAISFISDSQAIQRELQAWLDDIHITSGMLSLISNIIESGVTALHFKPVTTRYERLLQVLTALLNQTRSSGNTMPQVHSITKEHLCNTCSELSFYFTESVDHSQQNRRLSNLLIFINGRGVQYPRLKSAVQSVIDVYLSAFSTIQAGILWIVTEPGGCDPNVHPSKERVLLIEEEAIYSAIIDMLTEHMKVHYMKEVEPLLSQPRLKLQPPSTYSSSMRRSRQLVNALDPTPKGTSSPLYKQRHDSSTISILRFDNIQRAPCNKEIPEVHAPLPCSAPLHLPFESNIHGQNEQMDRSNSENGESIATINKPDIECKEGDAAVSIADTGVVVIQQVQDIQIQVDRAVNYVSLFDEEFGKYSKQSRRILASMNIERLIDNLPTEYDPGALPPLNKDTKLTLCGATTTVSSDGTKMLLGFLQSAELALICVDIGKLLVAKMLSCYCNLLSSSHLSHDIFYTISDCKVHSRKLAELLGDHMFGIDGGALVLAPHILVLLAQNDQIYKEILETIKRWNIFPDIDALESFLKRIDTDFCDALPKVYIELLVSILVDRIGRYPSDLCQALQAFSHTLLEDSEWRCYALTGYSAREVLQSFNRVV